MACSIKVADSKETARRLREVMDERNLKAIDIVNITNISKSSMSHYMNGSNTPSNLSASELARVLKVSPVWLMGFDVPKFDPAIQQGYDRVDMIHKYDELTPENKKLVETMVDALFSAQNKQK